MIKIKLLISVFLCACFSFAFAQESVHSSGGDATGNGGSVAYSVGQTLYTTNTGTTGTVSKGVQHAYEIFTLGIKDTELNVSLSVFPNPTLDNLTLEISNYKNEILNYALTDLNGRILESKSINSPQTQIIMSGLPAATYFLNIIQNDKKIQSFKINKN